MEIIKKGQKPKDKDELKKVETSEFNLYYDNTYDPYFKYYDSDIKTKSVNGEVAER